MQIGEFTTGRAARIDNHNLRLRALRFCLFQALKQHRMGPGGVRADKNDYLGLIQILVTARYGIRPKCPFIACHRGGHTQA